MRETKNWHIGFILPNIKVGDNFDSEYVSIVRFEDERIQKIIQENIHVATILNGFINEFKNKIEPSILIYDLNSPQQYRTTECFTDFRNIVAISVTLLHRSNLNQYNVTGPLFSDSFDFYPMLINADGSSIIETPALHSFRTEDAPFLGTATPGVPQFNLSMLYDKEIYNSLLKKWNLKYSKHKNQKMINRIFRSIEVAYHALSIPKKNQTSINDIGISISLWISAFEILAHPKRKNVQTKDVLDLLVSYPNYSKKLNKKKYSIRISNKNTKVSLVEKLYKKLYDSRNIFLHGNNIPAGILKTFDHKVKHQHNNIVNTAPVLYRYALYSYLVRHNILKQNSYKSYFDKFLDSSATINDNYNEFLKQIIKPQEGSI